ncbi:helix-turn-helix domain-containing protein [Anaerolactibacter massiliensis]|uniref:helix-turn-helix domain-containing protein n=1 Tax=Anaerolactibacter massiliensis TaxID=2044573 RepID=UPI000CF8AB60|nr:helix-turn-helix domain-containing protein [Anaerolactibacter massiliensis]
MENEYLNAEEAAQILRCSTRKIGELRSGGLLKGLRIGKAYIYRKRDIDMFFDLYAGYDLGNASKIRLAKQIQNKKSA